VRCGRANVKIAAEAVLAGEAGTTITA